MSRPQIARITFVDRCRVGRAFLPLYGSVRSPRRLAFIPLGAWLSGTTALTGRRARFLTLPSLQEDQHLPLLMMSLLTLDGIFIRVP
jgi:hypothetical protein